MQTSAPGAVQSGPTGLGAEEASALAQAVRVSEHSELDLVGNPQYDSPGLGE